MSKRLQSFISLKENAYQLAMEREFIKKEIVTYKICLHLKERYITEKIIRQTWDYHKNNQVNISDGQETRLIMLNCIYAGMFASKHFNMDSDVILDHIFSSGIPNVNQYVEKSLGFHGEKLFHVKCVGKSLVQDIYNWNTDLYDFLYSRDSHLAYYKDVACILFELGILYYENTK